MSKARILVVEDEVIIAKDIQRTLIRLGYEVPALSTSAEDALVQMAGVQPDLVLMDIHLSGEMDGITAADEIRLRNALPVVYMTAYSDEATLNRARITEPYGYVLKPFEERELKIAVEIALYRHMIEKKLRFVERWLATTLKSIGDAVITTDIYGNVTFMNQVAEALTGWPQADALGRPIEEVLRLAHEITRDMVNNLVERAIHESAVVEMMPNTTLITRSGTDIPVDDSAAPIRDDAGNITGVVIIFRDITTRKRAEERLHHLAVHDALTGLPNRALFTDRLSIAFEHAHRHQDYRFAVLFIDLDRFKVINDSLGHLFGDQVLITTAKRLAESLRSEDTVARLGGDEFAVLLGDTGNMRDAVHAAERIQTGMLGAINVNGQDVFTAASIGIALSGPQYELPQDMLRDADAALYKAKELGRNRFAVFDTELHEHAMRSLQLETELRRAVEREEFRIYYQPIVSLATRRIQGFEALLRWQHPERGLVPPP